MGWRELGVILDVHHYRAELFVEPALDAHRAQRDGHQVGIALAALQLDEAAHVPLLALAGGHRVDVHHVHLLTAVDHVLHPLPRHSAALVGEVIVLEKHPVGLHPRAACDVVEQRAKQASLKLGVLKQGVLLARRLTALGPQESLAHH